jgi:hypothetical protein
MRDNECNRETNKSRFEECHRTNWVRPEKGHLAQRLKWPMK